MENVFKAFFGIFFMVAIVSLGTGILAASLTARDAEGFLRDCVIRIENSNFSEEVMEACEEGAQERNFQLLIHPLAQEGTDRISYATCELTYEFSVPVIGLVREQKLYADMR